MLATSPASPATPERAGAVASTTASSGHPGDAVLKLASDALDLVQRAIYFDTTGGNTIAACDYYDLAILNIDEVLNKLNPASFEWHTLLDIRQKYDDRLEFLRELESSKYDLSILHARDGGGDKSPDPNTKIFTTKFGRKKQMPVAFEDMNVPPIDDSEFGELEKPPASLAGVPYWQLRLINRTIRTGGYLSPTLYVPPVIWTQVGVKFSGLQAKTTAFQNIVSITNTHLSYLKMPPVVDAAQSMTADMMTDIISKITAAFAAMKLIHEDFVHLQNQLSKPFPFIKEVVLQEESKELMSNTQAHNAGYQVARITNMAINIGKNVKKYAEIGYQRLGALPTRISEEEFAAYSALVSSTCEQCQVLNEWYLRLESLREAALAMVKEPPETVGHLSMEKMDLLIGDLEKILTELHPISAFIRDVVCEILLRDLSALMERYLNKTRKSFSRMFWDVDQAN